MSQNDQAVQDASLLFLSQLRTRPFQVVANINALLEGTGIELGFVQCPNETPANQSVFDWRISEEMAGA